MSPEKNIFYVATGCWSPIELEGGPRPMPRKIRKFGITAFQFPLIGISMYFLSDLEHKYLIHKLLPTTKEVGVSSELRGWSCHQP